VSDEELMLLQQLGVSQADLEMMQTFMGALLVVTVVAFVLTLWLARRKQLNMKFWTWMALLFGPFALLAVLFVQAKKSSSEPPQ
jgi:uncharacterized membrane protein YiaA